tara:strand:+ start:2595 stop:2834 length:240 start_codon:yes stop_codon:yes gene_type:complete
MNYNQALLYAANLPALVAQFDRLNGSNLSMNGSPLDLSIDKASGRQTEEVKAFIQFFDKFIWEPALSVDRASLDDAESE